MLYQKAQCVTGGTTAEAVIKLLLAIDRKRGRFFLMERAAGRVIFARTLELDACVNQIDDIGAQKHFIDK